MYIYIHTEREGPNFAQGIGLCAATESVPAGFSSLLGGVGF